jgi:sugar lactone lactonase YvrE
MKTALKVSLTITLVALSTLLTAPATAASNENSNTAKTFAGPTATLLVDSLASGSGSTIGPGGALFVTEGPTGSILRVDPDTGKVSTFATGLPPALVEIGGAMDVAFIGSTAYVLVTLVGEDIGGSDIVGIYRVDGPDSFTVIADLGAFSVANPPPVPFDVPTGLQYALEAYRGGLLVTDGHHNRVLSVSLEGEITQLLIFGDVVPTGLAVSGNTVYFGQAGPVPHLPQNGKVVSFDAHSLATTHVASGASLIVDVEFGLGRTLYALSQGDFPLDGPPGSPALPETGALLEVNAAGTFSVIIDGLNQPTSVEFIGNIAYVVTLGGEIWRIDNVSRPPYSASH